MAVQSKPYCRISQDDVLALEVFVEYDDANYNETNDDGDPDDFRVFRFYGTNHSSRDFQITVQRGNGQNWIDVTIPPGDFSQKTGGPVKYESDVPRWEYR